MRTHLKSAVKRYKEGEFKISPISKVDAEIIVELIEIFRKLEKKEIKDTLENWKYLSDEEIFNILSTWNTDNPDEPKEEIKEEEGKTEQEPEKLLRIGHYLISESRFHAVKFDPVKLRAIINPSTVELSGSPYTNMVIKFNDEDEYNLFEQNIEEHTGREIIKIH